MVTLGIVEENNEIKNFLYDFFSDKKADYTIYSEKYFFKPSISSCSEPIFDLIINNTSKSLNNPSCHLYMFNSDEKNNTTFLKETLVISYGLNSIATVTASSIDLNDDLFCFQYCLQRSILGFSGKKIEPMEFPVKLKNTEINIHSALAIVTVAMMYNF